MIVVTLLETGSKTMGIVIIIWKLNGWKTQ